MAPNKLKGLDKVFGFELSSTRRANVRPEEKKHAIEQDIASNKRRNVGSEFTSNIFREANQDPRQDKLINEPNYTRRDELFRSANEPENPSYLFSNYLHDTSNSDSDLGTQSSVSTDQSEPEPLNPEEVTTDVLNDAQVSETMDSNIPVSGSSIISQNCRNQAIRLPSGLTVTARTTRRPRNIQIPQSMINPNATTLSLHDWMNRPHHPGTQNHKENLKGKYKYDHLKFSTTVITKPYARNIAKTPGYDPEMHKDNLPEGQEHQKNCDQSDCEIRRTRFIRHDIPALDDHHPNVTYTKNPAFGITNPYAPEFFRTEHKNGEPSLRAGSCAYCKDLEFYYLKGSGYGNHLSLHHGISTKNYFYPESFSAGSYLMAKDDHDGRSSKPIKKVCYGAVCPCCFKLVQLHPSDYKGKITVLPFLSHFKKEHRINRDPGCF